MDASGYAVLVIAVFLTIGLYFLNKTAKDSKKA